MVKNKTVKQEGNIKSMVDLIIELIKVKPDLIYNPSQLKQYLVKAFPGMDNKDYCPNCGASMTEIIYEFDYMDAMLLIAMAKKVRENIAHSTFTEANKVSVPNLDTPYYIKIRQSQSGKLGLISKLKGKDGKHFRGMWVITSRGWSALRGEPVPKFVAVWRNKITERTEEQITIHEILNNFKEKYHSDLLKGRSIKTELVPYAKEYNQSEWVHFGNNQQGLLI